MAKTWVPKVGYSSASSGRPPVFPCVWRRIAPTRRDEFTAGPATGRAADPARLFIPSSIPSAPLSRILSGGDPGRELSPSLGALQLGIPLLVQSQATGFPDPGRWLPRDGISGCSPTSTYAIGPFLAMLGGEAIRAFRESGCWVQGAQGRRLTYQGPLITSLVEQYGPRFHYIALRQPPEPWPAPWPGRIRPPSPAARQARSGLAFSAEHSQVMICGNPAMVRPTQTLLDLGLGQEPARPRQHQRGKLLVSRGPGQRPTLSPSLASSRWLSAQALFPCGV